MCYQQHIQSSLPTTWLGKDLHTKGYIASLIDKKSIVSHFIFVPNQYCYHAQCIKAKNKLRLSWYVVGQSIHPGQSWQLVVRLKKPHGFANPGSFNYERWLQQQGIVATGYVKHVPKQNHLLAAHWYHAPLTQMRAYLRQRIAALFPQEPMLAFLTALSIGDRSGMIATQWQVLRDTGTSHLLAISGLHIGMIAMCAYCLVNFLWRCWPRLLLFAAAQQAAAVAAIIFAGFYALLAGFSVSSQRALIMIGVFMVATITKRPMASGRNFYLALFLVLFFEPMSVYSAGFYLSFLAVGLLLYCFNQRVLKASKLVALAKSQWVIFIGLLPLSFLLFQQYSGLALLSNMIAIPGVSFIILPLVLLGSLGLLFSSTVAYYCLSLALCCLQLLWWLLAHLAHYSLLTWHYALHDYWRVSLAMLGVFVLLAPAAIRCRYLAVVFFLPLLLIHDAELLPQQLKLTVLDVGQGLASVIETAHHRLIYDTGPRFSANFDAGTAVLIPYLHYFNHKDVDIIVISHGDSDHIGGLESVLKHIKVGTVISSVPKKIHHTHVIACVLGQHWWWDGIEFEMLYPTQNTPAMNNDSSCVLRIKVGEHSIILPGDIEKKGEQFLVKHFGKKLHADILIAPHHGSKTSSSAVFVNWVKPQYVVFATGYHNRFHFPHELVVKRYQQQNAVMLNTANDGAVTFFVSANQAIPMPQRFRKRE